MDNIVSLYRSTEGRISRKGWWLGIVGIIVLNIIIAFLLLPMFGVSMMPNIAAISSGDPAAVNQLIAESAQRAGWANLILFVVFAYPMYALSVKRRHDRDNNGLDVIVYLALAALMLLLQALGIGMEMTTIGGITVPTPAMWLNLVMLAVAVYALYLLVVLGFLKGTPGTNQYGPDPLAATATAAA